MKKRLISLLAMLAMLCTMVVIAMPTTAAAEDYTSYPAFSTYTGASDTRKDWTISSKADWDKMREVADAATADYFSGYTFHLTKDIDFAVDDANRQQPMGINTNGAAFAGTINGHGYGFNNIYICNSEKTDYGDGVLHTGLFLRLGNCKFVDFGLNSGLIRQISSGATGTISSFGTVMTGKVPTFERVWSSVYIAPYCSARINGLAGSVGNKAATVNVNGFVFDGVLAKGYGSAHKNQDSYAVRYTGESTNPGKFTNIITDFAGYNAKVEPGSSSNTYKVTKNTGNAEFALFSFYSKAAINASTLENIYAVKRLEEGIDNGYSIGTVMDNSNQSASMLTDMSAAEAAWTINNNPSQSATPVYFTLNAQGKVRPIPEGKSDGKIVKIAITGDAEQSIFVRPGSTVDLKAELGYTSNVSFVKVEGECTINGTSATVGTADVVVEMTNPCVDHNYGYTKGDKKHIATCSLCGYKMTEDCKLINCTINSIDWNVASHTGTCQHCGNNFTQNCDYEYKNTESGYQYVCSCGRTADAESPLAVGDVNEDGKIDLFDALRLLKKVASMPVEINERNADVDGSNTPDLKDVRKLILHYMNDPQTKADFKATEDRANEENYFKKENIEYGNLKMDGKEGTNERYIRTDFISVGAGNKVVFGPVRKAQAVLGHFYDKDGNAIELINFNNEKLKTEYAFKATIQEKDVEIKADGSVAGELKTKEVDGMLMVSITAPEGAAYVRLQANANEDEQYYIRINNEFSLADYQCRTIGDANTLTNIEKDQLFLVVGDSLCSAAADPTDKGWRGRIVRDYGVITSYSAQGGSALSTIRYLKENSDSNLDTDTNINSRQCIVNQINEWRDSDLSFEYILLEGGGNDCSQSAQVGYYENDDPNGKKLFNPTSYDPKDFAPESTYIGGLERAIYSAIKTYGDTAAIGYMSVYDGPYYGTDSAFSGMGNYFQYAKEVCDKWGIPYLDLFSILTEDKFNSRPSTEGKPNYDPNGLTTDGIHANADGYDVMQEYIGPFVTGIVPEEFKDEITETMRPVDQEVFLTVQQYKDLDKVIGPKK